MDFNIADNIKKMQSDFAAIKGRLKEVQVEGNAGAGMVTVKMDGDFNVREVHISSEIVSDEHHKVLEEMVASAISDAVRQIRERMQELFGEQAMSFLNPS